MGIRHYYSIDLYDLYLYDLYLLYRYRSLAWVNPIYNIVKKVDGVQNFK
jgi:hypothetical protein